MQVILPEADGLDAKLWKVEAMLRAQCLSNPLQCWEDRSVRGSALRHRKRLAMRETRYKICKLALNRHMLRTHIQDTHTSSPRHHMRTQSMSLSFPLYFPAQGFVFPNDQQRLRKCNSYPICGQRMIFSCCKSFPVMLLHRGVRAVDLRLSSKLRGQDVSGNSQCGKWLRVI